LINLLDKWDPRPDQTSVTRGWFITFEGGEGAGKSTQIRLLADRLTALGRSMVVTREPGGSAGAEQIRTLLVTGEADRWSPMSETLLLYAARADHLQRVIRPALEQGQIVVCDRFIDSTRAYQSGPGGVDPQWLQSLEQAVVEPTWPDLTLILDLPVSTGLERASQRGGAESRFESKGMAYHQRLRSAFLAMADSADRYQVVDASGSPAEVSERIWACVRQRLGI
jgi:dTMP kinase